MTPADIERMAREAGFAVNSASSLDAIDGRLARFAALVQAAERERTSHVIRQLELMIARLEGAGPSAPDRR